MVNLLSLNSWYYYLLIHPGRLLFIILFRLPRSILFTLLNILLAYSLVLKGDQRIHGLSASLGILTSFAFWRV